MPFLYFMDNREREKILFQFVCEELSADNSGHDHLHAMRVVTNARLLLEKEGGDESIIIAACYLHDCIDKKLFENLPLQKEKIIRLLQSLDYTKEQQDTILYIMENISFSSGKSKDLTNINARIVCDADRLDAIGAIGIIRTIEFGASRGRKFYNQEEVNKSDVSSYSKETTLAHFYDKLLLLKDLMFTDTAKRIAEKRSAFMVSFLDEFYEEVKE